MLEKGVGALANLKESLWLLATFAVVGVVIGLGVLLKSSQPLTPRLLIGRTLSTAGLSMAAGAVLVWVPDLSLIGQFGVAAGLACLGTAGLERLIARTLGSSSGLTKGGSDE